MPPVDVTQGTATRMKTSRKPRLAPRKDLHDGRSLWADTAGRGLRTRSASGNIETEIAIVGGGISGAIIGLVLARDGHEVAILDRRAPAEGSTIASTAMIQFEIDTPLTELMDKIGKEKAVRAYRRSLKAVRDLGALVNEFAPGARWEDREALYLAGNEMGFRALRQEAEVRAGCGLPSRYLEREEVHKRFGIDATGAILSKGAANLDPVATATGFLRAAQKLGAKLISPCEVTAIETASAREGVQLRTREGHIVSCRKAIFATGYEVIGGIPRSAFDIVSSWAIATQPLAPDRLWPTRCLIWEAADPYLYMRTTHDNRILIGGEDSGLLDPERREGAIPNKSKELLRKAKLILGRDDLAIDYAWAGAFADSPTGLPCFKELDDTPGVFAVLGCGGNGITFSMIASQVVKAWLKGRKDPDLDLFTGP